MGVTDPCPPDPNAAPNMSLRVAAVCYRRTENGLEFLLVRTRSNRGWTFPKGHVEPGESARHAARREAMEEAGVSGLMEAVPLTRYRYPVLNPSGHPAEVCVEAYLLDVEPGGGRAAERPTAWLPPADAVKKLAEGRPVPYARAHRRVIREALARLRSSDRDAPSPPSSPGRDE
jgi:8-oxo-dGTP pyrophosphatase MutT (NUDIX family)